jgi:hypothetical protein
MSKDGIDHLVLILQYAYWTVGNDPTYTPTTCFETFPFPWAPGAEPVDDPRVKAIAAAKDLVEQRDRC